MRILILVPQQHHASGNWVSAGRYKQGLEKLGHRVSILKSELLEQASLPAELTAFAPDVALLLHAYRSGKPWLKRTRDLMIPAVVVLTGTDINHGFADSEQRKIIQAVIERAAYVVLRNPLLAAGLSRDQPGLAARVKTVPPGVILGQDRYDLRGELGISQQRLLFLLPAGLRPVKDVIGLLQIFDLLDPEGGAFHLAFCGPLLDESYGRRFLDEVAVRPWASYLGVIPPGAMAEAMRGADVVINNSVSEGLANSLLEAATLGIPILARNNQGNAALVRHEVNGLLYDDARECLRQARRLFDKAYRMQLSRPDPSYTPEREAKVLESILMESVGNHRKGK